jgi:aspartate kinase
MPEFGVVARTDVAKINVELVSSTSGLEKDQDITLVVTKDHLNSAILKLNKIKEEIEAKDLLVDHNIAVISITHSGLSKTPGVGAKVFSALSSAKVNVEAVCSSTNAISCVIREEEASRAVEALKKELETWGPEVQG